MSLYGTISTSAAGYWKDVQHGNFLHRTKENDNNFQGKSNAGGGTSDYYCPESEAVAYLKASSGNGYGDAYCKYSTDRNGGGYSGALGKYYYAKATLHLKGIADDENWSSYAKLTITIEVYYTDGGSDVVIATKQLVYDSNNNQNTNEGVTIQTPSGRLSQSTQIYIRVTLNVHAVDGWGWSGAQSSIDYYGGGRKIDLYNWYLYEYQSYDNVQ